MQFGLSEGTLPLQAEGATDGGSQAEDICCGTAPLSSLYLRSNKVLGASGSAIHKSERVHLGLAKVDQIEVSLLLHHKVVRLHAAMHNPQSFPPNG